MKFQLGSDSIEIPTPANYPGGRTNEIIQVSERSAAGVTHVETYELKLKSYEFSYSELPTDQYSDLINWFNDIAMGMQNIFTVIDDLGETYEARFTTSILKFQITGFEQWGGSFTLEEER